MRKEADSTYTHRVHTTHTYDACCTHTWNSNSWKQNNKKNCYFWCGWFCCCKTVSFLLSKLFQIYTVTRDPRNLRSLKIHTNEKRINRTYTHTPHSALNLYDIFIVKSAFNENTQHRHTRDHIRSTKKEQPFVIVLLFGWFFIVDVVVGRSFFRWVGLCSRILTHEQVNKQH